MTILGKYNFTHALLKSILFFTCVVSTQVGFAANVNVVVTDSNDKILKDVVVYFEPQFKLDKPQAPANMVIDQRDKEFIPLVTAVQAGTTIRFPNNDKIRHHVYSFSKTKSFQIPLYKDKEPDPILFSKPGVVPLGCNIHDWMNAYVFVSESPYFSISDKQGSAQIKNLPQGKYLAKLYHPKLKNWKKQKGQSINVNNNMPSTSIKMKAPKMKKLFRAFRPPTGNGASAYQ